MDIHSLTAERLYGSTSLHRVQKLCFLVLSHGALLYILLVFYGKQASKQSTSKHTNNHLTITHPKPQHKLHKVKLYSLLTFHTKQTHHTHAFTQQPDSLLYFDVLCYSSYSLPPSLRIRIAPARHIRVNHSRRPSLSSRTPSSSITTTITTSIHFARSNA